METAVLYEKYYLFLCFQVFKALKHDVVIITLLLYCQPCIVWCCISSVVNEGYVSSEKLGNSISNFNLQSAFMCKK